MEENYDEIVRKWYLKLRKRFVDILMDKYSKTNMRLKDAEDIYQDAFLAIQENLQAGRISEHTSWSSYIITIGMNMAGKQYRRIGRTDSIDDTGGDDDESPATRARRAEARIRELEAMLDDDDDDSLSGNIEAQSILGNELTHTPEPCASMIRLSYYAGLTAPEILEEMPELKTAANVKVRRWKCMKDLTYRVKMALFNAGLISDKPEK